MEKIIPLEEIYPNIVKIYIYYITQMVIIILINVVIGKK